MSRVLVQKEQDLTYLCDKEYQKYKAQVARMKGQGCLKKLNYRRYCQIIFYQIAKQVWFLNSRKLSVRRQQF